MRVSYMQTLKVFKMETLLHSAVGTASHQQVLCAVDLAIC